MQMKTQSYFMYEPDKKAKEKRTNKKKISANNTRNTINLGRLTCD